MEKFPFTPAGLHDLLTQLFVLPDIELQQQADHIGNNFRTFIINHFQLSLSQLAFLESIDEKFITDASQSSKSFVERRMMIDLIKENPPTHSQSEGDPDDEDRGKLIDLDKKKNSSYSKKQGYQNNESLTFIIRYQIAN